MIGKKLRYFLEAIVLYMVFGIFKCLPPQTASNAGGWIGRNIGSLLAASRKARKHIKMAMPDKSDTQVNEIVRQMWENLGRVIAEYPHLEKISLDHSYFENKEELLSLFKKKDKPVIFIGGHLSNWEINSIALLAHHNISVDVTYRAPNNPWSAHLLNHARTLGNRLNAYPKSAQSGRKIMQALKDGHNLGILIDQKYNEGVQTNFFDIPAMTNPIAVLLSQRYRCPLVPVRNIRSEDGCSFKIITYPPLDVFDKKGSPLPVEHVLDQANKLLEAWIKENPGQWLWLHHRWK